MKDEPSKEDSNGVLLRLSFRIYGKGGGGGEDSKVSISSVLDRPTDRQAGNHP